jgi:hypothetical protein
MSFSRLRRYNIVCTSLQVAGDLFHSWCSFWDTFCNIVLHINFCDWNGFMVCYFSVSSKSQMLDVRCPFGCCDYFLERCQSHQHEQIVSSAWISVSLMSFI